MVSGEAGSRGRLPPGSRREARQCPPHLALAQPFQSPISKLTDSFSGDTQHAADLLQGMLSSAIEPEVEAEHLGVARREGAERGIDLFDEEVLHGLLFGISLLLSNEAVDHGAVALG